MTTDPATFTGLLEVCHANGLPTHGWEQYKQAWVKHPDDDSQASVRQAENATPTDLAAVCFEVARWLRDEHGSMVFHRWGGWRTGLIGAIGIGLNADNEPAALLAACKGVGK